MDAARDNAVVNSGYRRALNSLRGLASLCVVFYHVRYFSDFRWFDSFPALRYGYIGVDFFFILSGLIISHVYLRQSAAASPRFWAKFVWLRIARLFPVHLLVMVLLLLAALVGPFVDENWGPLRAQQFTDWISLTLLIRQWTLPDGYVWNTPAWSVSAEFFAYLFIFPLVSRFARNSNSSLPGVAFVLVGLSLFAALVSAANTVNVAHGAGPLIRVTAGFLVGSGLYLLLTGWVTSTAWDRVLAWTLVGALPLVALLAICARSNASLDLLIIAYLVVLISATYHAQRGAAKIMSQPIPFWMGEISFSLYLCHVPVMGMLSYLAPPQGIGRGFLFGMMCVGLSVVAAHFLYRIVEIPCRDYLRAWFDAQYDSVSVRSVAPISTTAD